MNSKTKRPEVSTRLRAALIEVRESLTGGRPLTSRTVEVRQPEQWDARGVKKIRCDLGLSQAPFARLIGVSPELVEHWEQDIATPRGPASRLLTEIARDPVGYLERYVICRRTWRPGKRTVNGDDHEQKNNGKTAHRQFRRIQR
jgi:DNA-binding transcriptional regulator YiaG